MAKPLFLLVFINLIFVSILEAQDWKTYPYHEEGSSLYFPVDEGRHSEEPIEWWYANAHLTGEQSGNAYSIMLTYFYFPAYGFDGFRILNIADDTAGNFFDETLPVQYETLAEDHLNIQALVVGAGTESWVTRRDPQGKLLPFQYQLNAGGRYGTIDLTFDTRKRPLMVGETGFLYQGQENYTYYYSQTAVDVTGTLTIAGVTERVKGTAWIDRQYGDFNPYYGEHYEWFNLQLSNGMDINLWNIFTPDNQLPDTSTYRYFSAYVDEENTFTTSDFTLERLTYAWMPDKLACYSQKWRLVAEEYDLDLMITTLHSDQEVRLPFRFYEGAISITGTIGGQSVTGKGFAELLRQYHHPQLELLNPKASGTWDPQKPLAWRVLDPDDGRPLRFDLEVSTDEKQSFVPLAQGLQDTFFLWDSSGLSADSSYWLRLTGSSVDGTLTSTLETQMPFSLTTAVYELQVPKVTIFPNPSGRQMTIDFEQPVAASVQLRLVNTWGRLLGSTSLETGQQTATLTVGNIPSGIYLLEVRYRGSVSSQKVVIK